MSLYSSFAGQAIWNSVFGTQPDELTLEDGELVKQLRHSFQVGSENDRMGNEFVCARAHTIHLCWV